MKKKLTYPWLLLLCISSIVPAWVRAANNDSPTQACINEIVEKITVEHLKNPGYIPKGKKHPINKEAPLVKNNPPLWFSS